MDQIEERRLFTYDERKAVLKRTYGICACCGKKLTTKTMTVEHVIPLLRGGTNDIENLIALCYDCNQLKGNLLYLPLGFYSALADKPLLNTLEKYVEHWFQTISSEFDLQSFPMIAPRYNMIMVPTSTHKRAIPFSKQLLLQWSLIGTDTYSEIEAVTELNTHEMRDKMNRLCHKNDHPVALYSLRKVTTDKILAVVGVLLDIENNYLTIYMPWCCITKPQVPNVLYIFVRNILNSIVDIARVPITAYTLATDCDRALNIFYRGVIPKTMGVSYQRLHLSEIEYAIELQREKLTPR